MTEPTIDIILTTMNRPDCLKRTLAHIYNRTRSPYRLTVLDDASTDGNAEWLFGEWRAEHIHNLVLHGQRIGAMAQLNQGAWMSFSDPVVFTDDDVLCPDVEPDWLARGREAILSRPGLALLALNHPRAHRKVYDYDGVVTYCLYVGGTFMFVRRQFLMAHPLPHFWSNFGTTPTTKRCQIAAQEGWKVGFLADTYCQHIGHISVMTGAAYQGGRREAEADPITLEPLDERFRGPYGPAKP
jgi:hypothetical protein